MEGTKSRKFFITVLLLLYLGAIALTYTRVYVLHAYPVYYSEDEMPDMYAQIRTIIFWKGHDM